MFLSHAPAFLKRFTNPRDTWEDKAAYDEAALKLAKMFHDNFSAKYPDMPENIANAGPNLGK